MKNDSFVNHLALLRCLLLSLKIITLMNLGHFKTPYEVEFATT